MKELSKSLFRKFSYVAAIIITIAALAVIAGRIIVPMLDTHRSDIEAWASTLLDGPVNIEKVRLSWYRYQPVVSLQNVTFLDKQKKEPVLQIKKVSIFFSIPKSIWHWKFILSGLLISGTDINVHETSGGEYVIQGFPALKGFDDQPYAQESKFSDTMAWLAEQPRIILRDVDIRYTGFSGQKRFVTLYDLYVSNSSLNHTIIGKAILHQELPTELTLAIDWQGNPRKLNELSSNVYVYVSGMSLAQWLGDYPWQNWELKKGLASAKIWASWEKGEFTRIQSLFQIFSLDLLSQKDKLHHLIRRISGDVAMEKRDGKYVVAGEDVLIDLPDHLWPLTGFELSLVEQEDKSLALQSLRLDYADLSDVQTYLFSSSIKLPPDMLKLLKNIQLKGSLQDLSMQFPAAWDDVLQLSITAKLQDAGILPWQHYPGIQHMSANLQWNGLKGSGNVDINSKGFILQHDAVFAEPLALDQLSGKIAFHQALDGKLWELNFAEIQSLNSDFGMNINGKLTLSSKGSPVADIKANFTMSQVARIQHYLPMKFFDKELASWLKQAFLSGEVKSANAILQGSLNEFPFENGTGVFSVSGKISHIDFRFAPDWPQLNQLNGSIQFNGRSLNIDVDQAKIMDIPIGPTHGEIPYLGPKGPAILTVKSNDIKTDFSNTGGFVHASPLEKNIGRMYNHLNLSGPIVVQLDLTVPLAKPADTKVRGDIAIRDGKITLPSWKLEVNKLNGNVGFTEDAITAKDLQAQLFGEEINFDLDTAKNAANHAITRAKFSSRLKLENLEAWLKLPISDVAKGSAAISGVLDLSFDDPINILIASNLKGISLNLPDQYAKSADKEINSSINIIAQDKEPIKLKFRYGELVSAAILLNKKDEKYNLLAANLRLGAGDASWPQANGLYVSGHLAKLNWDEIKSHSSQSSGEAFAGLHFQGLDIEIGELNVFGLQLKNPIIKLMSKDKNWQVNINSSLITGEIVVPKVFSRKETISANIQRLTFTTDKNDKKQRPEIDLATLPALDITISNLSYNDMPLGRLSLQTATSTKGQQIKSLSLVASNLNLQSTGLWTDKMTKLSGNAKSEHFSEYLNRLGIDAHNFISNKAKFDFDISWQDRLFYPSLASLSGHVSLDIGPGRIVEVGEDTDAKLGLGRMLSLFSLQTIPRRLSLDFSDLFQKGYSFDYLRGQFKLSNGDAYTTNTRFSGPVANVNINGRIGLEDKDFDLTLGVNPIGVTSTLPVAAAFLSGPVGGFAALAVNQVIGSQVSKAAGNFYEVSGSWANPQWKQVGGSGKR